MAIKFEDIIDATGQLINNVGTPVASTDAANKGYVDTAVAGGGGAISTFYVSSIINVTTTSATDILLTSMALTPGAGSYLIFFDATASHNSNQAQCIFSIYANGIVVADSVRVNTMSPTNAQNAVHINTKTITLLVGQTIDVRWRTNTPTATCYTRSLTLIKI